MLCMIGNKEAVTVIILTNIILNPQTSNIIINIA